MVYTCATTNNEFCTWQVRQKLSQKSPHISQNKPTCHQLIWRFPPSTNPSPSIPAPPLSAALPIERARSLRPPRTGVAAPAARAGVRPRDHHPSDVEERGSGFSSSPSRTPLSAPVLAVAAAVVVVVVVVRRSGAVLWSVRASGRRGRWGGTWRYCWSSPWPGCSSSSITCSRTGRLRLVGRF